MELDVHRHVNEIMEKAHAAFLLYCKTDKRNKRASFLREIAGRLENIKTKICQIASKECHLSKSFIEQQLRHITGQLRLFSDILEEGSWVEAVIDNTPSPQHDGSTLDIRMLLEPIGTVVVSASDENPVFVFKLFGNGLSALAAGATVVFQYPPKYSETFAVLYDVLTSEVKVSGLPFETIQRVEFTDALTEAFVQHSFTSAVCYTGTMEKYTKIRQWTADRRPPIPLLAYMDSLNPVVIYPEYMTLYPAAAAKELASWITGEARLHPSSPQLILVMTGEGLSEFIRGLEKYIHTPQASDPPNTVLYQNEPQAVRRWNSGVEYNDTIPSPISANLSNAPLLLKTTAEKYLLTKDRNNSSVRVLLCRGEEELKNILQSIEPQSTTTLMATDMDLEQHAELVKEQQRLAARVVLNDSPLEETPCCSMIHGGRFPASTDFHYSSEGLLAMKRWLKPACYQNFPRPFLPDELKTDNPLHIMRLYNKQWRR